MIPNGNDILDNSPNYLTVPTVIESWYIIAIFQCYCVNLTGLYTFLSPQWNKKIDYVSLHGNQLSHILFSWLLFMYVNEVKIVCLFYMR